MSIWPFSNAAEAKRLNSEAIKIVESSIETTNYCRNETERCLRSLGRTKVGIMTCAMSKFVECFSLIKHIELSEVDNSEAMADFDPTIGKLQELHQAVLDISTVSISVAAASAGGALAAYAATGAVSTFAVASTGTAISTLSGAAATNAMLAFLGGGSLAAGGGGVFLGTLVLGGIVAVPAVFFAATILHYKSKSALNQAKNNHDIACAFRHESVLLRSKMHGINTMAAEFNGLLISLGAIFEEAIGAMESIVESNEADWCKFNAKQKTSVFLTFQLAQLIKLIIDTSIIASHGGPSSMASETLQRSKAELYKVRQLTFRSDDAV